MLSVDTPYYPTILTLTVSHLLEAAAILMQVVVILIDVVFIPLLS